MAITTGVQCPRCGGRVEVSVELTVNGCDGKSVQVTPSIPNLQEQVAEHVGQCLRGPQDPPERPSVELESTW